ncbi:MAG: PPC domain-containing protein [Planctomycetota bacterium]
MRKKGLGALLAVTLVCVGACSDSDNNTSAPQVPGPAPTDNLAPVFAGLKAIATAGGGSVRLCWSHATDDKDHPSQIRYRMYASSVRGTQNFGSAALETAPGVTCITVSAVQSTRQYYVIRAVDSEGAEDGNRIEVSVTPLPVGNVVYVDGANDNPGDGTIGNPFQTIQEGVDFAETLGAGGIVLVARGTYNAQVRVTATGSTSPLHIFGGFPSWGSFTAPTPEQILETFDPEANPTTVDGTGVTQFTAAGEALVHVANDGRPTFVGALRISNAEEIGIGGFVVDLEITCTVGRDPDGGEGDNVTQAAVQFGNLLAAMPNHAVVVGSDLREFARTGVEASGFTDWLQVSGNFIGHDQANSSSTTGIGMSPTPLPPEEAALAGELIPVDTIIVPTEHTTEMRMENNEIFRTNEDGISLDFSPEQEAAAGMIDLLIRGNDISFVDSGSAVRIEDLLYFGDGGEASVTIDQNRFISIEDATVEIDWIETQVVNDGSAVDGPTTVVVDNNWHGLADDGVGEFDDMIPPAGGTCSLTYTNNQAVNIESTAMDLESYSPEGPGPIDGVLEFIMTDNRLAEINGEAPELDFHNPPGAGGMLSLWFEDNLHANPDGDTAYELDVDSTMGANPADTVYNQSITLRYNTVLETSDAGQHIDLSCFTSNGTCNVDVMDNLIIGGGGIGIFHDDEGTATGPLGTATIQVVHNFLFVHDDYGIEVDVDATSLTVLDILHNYANAYEIPIDVEVDSGSSPNGRVHTTVFNNRIDNSDDEQLEYDDETNAANGDAAYLFVGNNNLAHGVESSGTEIRIEEHAMVLFANNFVGFGEVDSDDGLEIDLEGSNPGLVTVRNNIFGFIPGDAVDLGSSNAQFINNTVAYNGMGGTTSDYGIVRDDDGQPFVLNSITWMNGGADLDPDDPIATSYSLIGDQDPAVGFGDVTGDPLLIGMPDLFNFNANYMLRPGSPAIDAGSPAPEFNDPDGTRNDMGTFGGPGAGWVGSFLPVDPEDEDGTETPEVPLLVLGVGRPFDSTSTLVGLAAMHAGSPLRPIGPNDGLSIVFTRPVQAGSLGGITISADGQLVPGTLVLRNGGRVAVFVPNAAVPAGDPVSISVSSAVLAEDTGTPLAVPFQTSIGTLPAATPEAEDAAGPDSNGSAGTAEAIAGVPSSLNVTGTLFDATDSDFYSFTGSAGERVQATVLTSRLATPNNSSMTLTLYAGDGTTVLATNDGNAGSVNGGQNDPFVDFVLPAAGTYYLQVSNGAGDYQLHWYVR